MDIIELITTFLSPFLPHLVKSSQPIAEGAGKELGKKLGEGSWDKAKKIWNTVSSKIQKKPLAKGAIEALEVDTQDKDAQNILLTQIQKLLKADPVLAQKLHQLVSEDEEVISKAISISQNVQGNKNIVIGQSNNGLFHIT